MIIDILLFMFPAGLSLKIREEFFAEEKQIKNIILVYMKYNLIVNLLMFTILYFYSSGESINILYSLESISFIFKYLLLSFIIAIVVPIVDEYIKKYIQVNFKFKVIEKIEKKNVKKNN